LLPAAAVAVEGIQRPDSVSCVGRVHSKPAFQQLLKQAFRVNIGLLFTGNGLFSKPVCKRTTR
jgi:hypothetical protein